MMELRGGQSEEFKRFDDAVGKLLSVPKSVILEREAAYRAKAALNPNKRGPKPKNKGGASPLLEPETTPCSASPQASGIQS